MSASLRGDTYGTGQSVPVTPASEGTAKAEPGFVSLGLTMKQSRLDEDNPDTNLTSPSLKNTVKTLNEHGLDTFFYPECIDGTSDTLFVNEPNSEIYGLLRFTDSDGEWLGPPADPEDPESEQGSDPFAYRAKSYVIRLDANCVYTNENLDKEDLSHICLTESGVEKFTGASITKPVGTCHYFVSLWLMDTPWDPEAVTWNNPPTFKGVRVDVHFKAENLEPEGGEIQTQNNGVEIRIEVPLDEDGSPIPIYGIGAQMPKGEEHSTDNLFSVNADSDVDVLYREGGGDGEYVS